MCPCLFRKPTPRREWTFPMSVLRQVASVALRVVDVVAHQGHAKWPTTTGCRAVPLVMPESSWLRRAGRARLEDCAPCGTLAFDTFRYRHMIQKHGTGSDDSGCVQCGGGAPAAADPGPPR